MTNHNGPATPAIDQLTETQKAQQQVLDEFKARLARAVDALPSKDWKIWALRECLLDVIDREFKGQDRVNAMDKLHRQIERRMKEKTE